MADDNVSLDAQVSVKQDRVLTRDDELRLFALQTATKEPFRFDKAPVEEVRENRLADARAFYNFLTDKESNPDG